MADRVFLDAKLTATVLCFLGEKDCDAFFRAARRPVPPRASAPVNVFGSDFVKIGTRYWEFLDQTRDWGFPGQTRLRPPRF